MHFVESDLYFVKIPCCCCCLFVGGVGGRGLEWDRCLRLEVGLMWDGLQVDCQSLLFFRWVGGDYGMLGW